MLAGAFMLSAAHAQIVGEGESALVYYSPKTEIVVDFGYDVVEEEAGPYASYAEELLGVKNAVLVTKTTYFLKTARILTATTTDYSRPHKVTHDPAIPMLLNINEKSLLCGYNAPLEEKKPFANRPKENPIGRAYAASIVPYTEEILKAANMEEEAKNTAQQIFHLREMRQYLLSGEVEHAPADGRSMELVLGELNKQEQALTDLFIGKKNHHKAHREFRFEPTGKEQKWYFSEENGFTEAENIDAEVISVSTVLYPQRYVANEEDNKAKKKPALLSQIVYNLPGSGDIKVVYKGTELAKRTLPIAQIGIDVPLPRDLFTGKEMPVIRFSEKTGNIVSISK